MRRRCWPAALAVAGVLAAAGCADVVEAGPDAPADGFVDVTVAASGGEFAVGDCLTWDQGGDTAVFEVVPCDTDHLVEVAGSIDVSDVFAVGASYPDGAAVAALVERCDGAVAAYLGRATRADEQPGIVLPTEQDWAAGDRSAICTVGLARVDGQRRAYQGRLVERG